ncbi:Glutamate--tRNA ligase [Candidatus Hepatincolaceae symbiont of Richtersius coronifer]
MKVITRFAPSPTGYLHIGGARTALFNYLYSKHTGGKFLLRIEDTDLQRSTPEAVEAIFTGLNWLELTPDEPPVFQMQRQQRHIEAAEELLNLGNAYKCYCTKEELQQRRKEFEAQGKVYTYESRCLNLTPQELTARGITKSTPYAVRIKIARTGTTVINDLVMGTIEIQNTEIDDFIILRSDKVPTYMFAVVVDDHDMEITHIIRGDDHLTNAFRQYHVYLAFNWFVPQFAHLPLIYSPEGNKLSKRHGAAAVGDYQGMGFLPKAVRNYLLRLGWSHQNHEIILDSDAIKWFDVKEVNKSPARFDMAKLISLNSHYLKQEDNATLIALMQPFIEKFITKYRLENPNLQINPDYKNLLKNGLDSLKQRSTTLIELTENSWFYIINPPFNLDENSFKTLNSRKETTLEIIGLLEKLTYFSRDNLHNTIKAYADNKDIKLGTAVEGLRVLLVGKNVSPASVFDIILTLGPKEALFRLRLINHYINV